MQKKLTKIKVSKEVNLTISDNFFLAICKEIKNLFNEQITWLNNSGYDYTIMLDIESEPCLDIKWASINTHTLVIYLKFSYEEHAIHYKLVWGADGNI